MILKSITLENFKAISEPVRVDFKPITLLFGQNSAGKSTIIQALLYMHELLERNNTDPGTTRLGGQLLNLGGFRNLVHNHDLSREIRIRVDFALGGSGFEKGDDGYRGRWLPIYLLHELGSMYIEELTGTVATFWIEVCIRRDGKLKPPGPMVSQYEVGADGADVARIVLVNNEPVLKYLNFQHPVFNLGPREETVEEGVYAEWRNIDRLFEACVDPSLFDVTSGNVSLPVSKAGAWEGEEVDRRDSGTTGRGTSKPRSC